MKGQLILIFIVFNMAVFVTAAFAEILDYLLAFYWYITE